MVFRTGVEAEEVIMWSWESSILQDPGQIQSKNNQKQRKPQVKSVWRPIEGTTSLLWVYYMAKLSSIILNWIWGHLTPGWRAFPKKHPKATEITKINKTWVRIMEIGPPPPKYQIREAKSSKRDHNSFYLNHKNLNGEGLNSSTTNAKSVTNPTKLNKKDLGEKKCLAANQLLKIYRLLIVFEANNIRV